MSDSERHQNCPYFSQNAWQMSEGKYQCLKYPDDLFFLEETPPECIKGLKEYQLPKPDKEYNPQYTCKIYKFERKVQ